MRIYGVSDNVSATEYVQQDSLASVRVSFYLDINYVEDKATLRIQMATAAPDDEPVATVNQSFILKPEFLKAWYNTLDDNEQKTIKENTK